MTDTEKTLFQLWTIDYYNKTGKNMLDIFHDQFQEAIDKEMSDGDK